MLDRVALISVWNSALWVEHQLRQLYPRYDRIIISEANWTSDDHAWCGDTSPDGTAELIRSFPDRESKIDFRQLGRWQRGCLAARAEISSRVPPCRWLHVCDVDEFLMDETWELFDKQLDKWASAGYTTVSQHTRSFYWDWTRATLEGFTRIYRWYPGLNPWNAHYGSPRDLNVPREFGQETPTWDRAGLEIYHASYIPTPGVRIKGAQSFDVAESRYRQWYQEVFSAFNGENLADIYRSNAGGVHVFGGMELNPYTGKLPEVLDDHPLRHARWIGSGYVDGRSGAELALTGWWNKQ